MVRASCPLELYKLNAQQLTEGLWLRWYNQDGDWIPTFAERAEQEKQRADKLQRFPII
ncbi:hypothetical protein NIES806_40760 [Dolichospermum compactum NIES-806]|uniref:Uncharacterized protein n=1 Tax=Dolichospermum compactum NIES-806 TaxID=1973481 RepID=A0A1Z4V8T4_9CYAN|nr:hypothetical protein NIES806_40760 [Dolichospermum compactum NIES-806]